MTRRLNSLTLGVATIALAGVFAFSPSFVPVPGSMDGAAFAKNGKGGGGGGGGNEKARGGGKDKGDRGGGGNRSAKKDKGGKPSWAGGKKNETRTASAKKSGSDDGELHASQKGRWNAANANQAALDAHMRNGNYNGTIGALTQYQLAAKAADDYEGLSELEKSALDSFDLFKDVEISDQELADLLNDGAAAGEPMFDVVDGVVTCTSDCPTDATELADLESNAQMAADDFVDMEQQMADEQAIDDFYTASEQRILDESNKSTAGIEDQLLDDIAKDLGVTRPEPEEAPEGDDLAVVVE